MANTQWSYPGSRWWKFDFHTHTPASKDTPWHRMQLTLTPQDWLLKYMAAEIDCVAVTDHNSGAWIDQLKAAYAAMQANPPAGFRELHIFPGVEISVSSGFHLLAIFDTNKTTRTITDLLAVVDYRGEDGDSDDGVTGLGPEGVFQAILSAGGLPIPAHADKPDDNDKKGKGLLALQNGSNSSCVDAHTLRGIFDSVQLLAVEWVDMNRKPPTCVQAQVGKLTRVLGSDCHTFQGFDVPGSRYTWVKMASPSLEGLRLALLDGNGVSIRRSDEGEFDPFQVPTHMVTAIEIEKARFMGNRVPSRLEFSPFFNAVIGGRGTGKSTVVHALRLAARREAELAALPAGSEPRTQFEAFCKVAKGRDDKGAIRPETVIRVEWQHDTQRLRLHWSASNSQVTAVEEWHGEGWEPSPSQSINAERFPLRIFSQGQIAALAGSGRQTLLSIIDEAAQIEPLKQAIEDAQRTYFTQCARLREIDGQLAGLAEVDRKLAESERKLAALSQTDHASVLRAYAQAQHQTREVKCVLEQFSTAVQGIANLPEQLVLDDWASQHFTEYDADLISWRQGLDTQLEQMRAELQERARNLTAYIESAQADERYLQWRARVQAVQHAHADLQQKLVDQGVSDPQAFARLTSERQQLETQRKSLQQMQTDRKALEQQIEAQGTLIAERRRTVTQARERFIEKTLTENRYVRITVVPGGFDARQIERELRELIDALDDRFADDILNDEASGGMAYDLEQASDDTRDQVLDTVRQCLLLKGEELGGWLRNHLQRLHKKPEFADRISIWSPQDDLKIEYQREKRWEAIDQASQGQRSAALLAFLLAFGEEPIVLDQPEDDLDNHLIYELIVEQIRENKLRRQLIVVTHNPNVVVNGDAEMVYVMGFGGGQCLVKEKGALQEKPVRQEVCRVMEGGHNAFERRWKRLGREV